MKKRENETEEQIENSYSCRYNKAYIEEMMKIARGEDENEVL